MGTAATAGLHGSPDPRLLERVRVRCDDEDGFHGGGRGGGGFGKGNEGDEGDEDT